MKFHFANSDAPLKEGSTIKGLCGAEIPKAAFIAQTDLMMFTIQPHRIGTICRKCWNSEWSKRFLYVVASGQEAMTGDVFQQTHKGDTQSRG